MKKGLALLLVLSMLLALTACGSDDDEKKTETGKKRGENTEAVTPTDEVTPTPTEEATPTPTEEVTPTPTEEITPAPNAPVNGMTPFTDVSNTADASKQAYYEQYFCTDSVKYSGENAFVTISAEGMVLSMLVSMDGMSVSVPASDKSIDIKYVGDKMYVLLTDPNEETSTDGSLSFNQWYRLTVPEGADKFSLEGPDDYKLTLGEDPEIEYIGVAKDPDGIEFDHVKATIMQDYQEYVYEIYVANDRVNTLCYEDGGEYAQIDFCQIAPFTEPDSVIQCTDDYESASMVIALYVYALLSGM